MLASLEREGEILIITLEGPHLDAGRSRELRSELEPLLENGSKVVFDLGRLDFVDSSGLGVILSSLRRVNGEGGDLKLCSVRPEVRSILELVRLHRVVELFERRDDAIAAF